MWEFIKVKVHKFSDDPLKLVEVLDGVTGVSLLSDFD